MATRSGRTISSLGLLSVFALVTTGLVLATSWFIQWPDLLMSAAGAVGAMAVTGVIIVSIRDSRSKGVSTLRATGRSVVDVLRFLRDAL